MADIPRLTLKETLLVVFGSVAMAGVLVNFKNREIAPKHNNEPKTAIETPADGTRVATPDTIKINRSLKHP